MDTVDNLDQLSLSSAASLRHSNITIQGFSRAKIWGRAQAGLLDPRLNLSWQKHAKYSAALEMIEPVERMAEKKHGVPCTQSSNRSDEVSEGEMREIEDGNQLSHAYAYLLACALAYDPASSLSTWQKLKRRYFPISLIEPSICVL